MKSDKQEEITNNGEPVFEQSSFSDLVNKYYLDTNITCDVNIFFQDNIFHLIFFQQKFVSKQDDFSKAGSYALNALHKVKYIFK